MPRFVSRIPWRLKSIAFRLLSQAPLSVHRWLSTHVTGRALRDLSNERYFQALDAHLSAFNSVPNSSDAVLLEFGAGADLFSSLYFFSKGVRHQLVVDLDRNVSPEALNGLLAHAEFMKENLRFTSDFEAELRRLGITYQAPYDLRDTDLADRSVGFICSTNTLEHIPRADLARIFMQCSRIIQADGALSMWIDYSDHYSHTDPSINVYNFLKYSARDWTRHNSRLQYQNRLRHCQYRELFVECGFEVLQESRVHPPEWQRALGQIQVHKGFDGIPPEELGAIGGHFVLGLAASN